VNFLNFSKRGRKNYKAAKLIDGFEAMEILGVNKGKELGEALDSLKNAQIKGSVKTRKDAVNFLIKYRKTNF